MLACTMMTTNNENSLPRNKKLRNVLRERLRHVLGTDVGDPLQGEAHVHRIPRHEVVLDAVVDQVDQVAVLADQHRNEEVSLEGEEEDSLAKQVRKDTASLKGWGKDTFEKTLQGD